MKNIYVRQNMNGTASLNYRRQFRGDVFQYSENSFDGKTIQERIDAALARNAYLERMYELTKSRTSMADIITAKKLISITGIPNKNARVMMYLNNCTVSWSIRKHGLMRSIKIACATLLTRLGIHDEGNRAIFTAVLKNRALEDYNARVYQSKKTNNARCPEIRKVVSELHKKFKADKYKLSKASHAVESKLNIECYLMIQYEYVRIQRFDPETKTMQWDSVFAKCLCVDSVSSYDQRKGHFHAVVNELMIAMSRLKYDALKIKGVLNPDLEEALTRNKIFTKSPDYIDDGEPKYNEFQSDFVRIRDYDSLICGQPHPLEERKLSAA